MKVPVDAFEDCFADYSDAVQSRLSWAPAWAPEHLKARGL